MGATLLSAAKGRGRALGTIWGLARLVALVAAPVLAGCVTTAENSLSKNDITSMKLTGVTVSFAPDAGVQWEDGIRAYAAARPSDDQIATASNTPEGNAYIRTMLAPVIQSGVSKSMAGQLVGSRPVRLDVVVKSFALASAVQRILIGGGRGMVADANLVDARTGAIIIASPNLVAGSYAGQGIVGTAVQAAIDSSSDQSVAEKLASRYGNIYRNWLLRQS